MDKAQQGKIAISEQLICDICETELYTCDGCQTYFYELADDPIGKAVFCADSGEHYCSEDCYESSKREAKK